jgi:ABC-type nickel/cobalt efflux system permease component RcnA
MRHIMHCAGLRYGALLRFARSCLHVVCAMLWTIVLVLLLPLSVAFLYSVDLYAVGRFFYSVLFWFIC